MHQYETFELTFQGPVLTENWAAVDVKASFTHEGKAVTVPGFYDASSIHEYYEPEDLVGKTAITSGNRSSKNYLKWTAASRA